MLGRNSQNKPNDFGFMLYCTVEPICIIHHYLFKIFCCFWLAPIPRLILYDQNGAYHIWKTHVSSIYYLEGCWRPWWKTSSSICIIFQIPLSLIQYLLNIKPNLTILGMANDTCNNPLSPSIHIQIPHTDLHTFPLRISWENLIKHQGIFSFVIIFHILTTLSLDNVWTLLGENYCWSFVTCTPASDTTPTGPIAATAKKILHSESRSPYMATFTGAVCKQWMEAFAEGNKVF